MAVYLQLELLSRSSGLFLPLARGSGLESSESYDLAPFAQPMLLFLAENMA